jgi:hypothetical protein
MLPQKFGTTGKQMLRNSKKFTVLNMDHRDVPSSSQASLTNSAKNPDASTWPLAVVVILRLSLSLCLSYLE